MSLEPRTVAVLGAGAWGTALSIVAARAGHAVRLWARDDALLEAIRRTGTNERYLPGIPVDPTVGCTADATAALSGADLVLAAIPAQQLRQALHGLAAAVPAKAVIVICAKGIEQSSGALLSHVVGQALPGRPVAALSGPGFAAEVAAGLPTAVVIAATRRSLADRLARSLSSPAFRCYSSDDLVGVEIGGALKNVLAIAAGTVAGARLGASAQAAMVTRGFVELRRLAVSFGARPETVVGLSGLGDLLLTCSTPQSRNYSYGLALGQGEALDGRPLAEGVATASIAARLARERGIAAPIIEAVDMLVRRRLSVGEAVSSLMTRPIRSEGDD